jgi:hypothetical protein
VIVAANTMWQIRLTKILSVKYLCRILKKYAAYFTLFILLSVQACRPQLSKEDAIKHLRAFDLELINLATSINNTTSVKLLKKIASIENAPLPFIAHRSAQAGGMAKFNFEAHKGFYQLDSTGATFNRINQADSIIVLCPGLASRGEDVLLIISQYAEEAGGMNVKLPLRLVAEMYVGNKRTLYIDHASSYLLQLPSFNKTLIELEKFTINLNLQSKARPKHVRAEIDMIVTRDKQDLLTWKTKAKLKYNHPGTYTVLSFDSQFLVFPVAIKAKVNSAAINADIADYHAAFNKHSQIDLFRARDEAILGQIILERRQGKDTFDPAVLFNDGSILHLNEFIITVEQVLNFKFTIN